MEGSQCQTKKHIHMYQWGGLWYLTPLSTTFSVILWWRVLLVEKARVHLIIIGELLILPAKLICSACNTSKGGAK